MSMTAEPAVIEDSVKLAAEHEAAGVWARPRLCWTGFSEKNPKDAEAVHLKGVLAVRGGRTAEGAELMERSNRDRAGAAVLSAQSLRGLPYARSLRRRAAGREEGRGGRSRRSDLPRQPLGSLLRAR